MEKDNKYYGIIENLVRNHRKFNGCEPILDDIIDDVYKHAKSVIGSVKDDDVVLSYLQKLVSVSVITVPRRMNFHQEVRHRDITAAIIPEKKPEPVVAEIKQEVIPEVNNVIEVAEPEPETKANTELVDRMINSIDSASIEETSQDDNNLEFITEDNLETLQIAEDDYSEQTEFTMDFDTDDETETIETLELLDNNNDEQEIVNEDNLGLTEPAETDDFIAEDNSDNVFEPDKEEEVVVDQNNNSDDEPAFEGFSDIPEEVALTEEPIETVEQVEQTETFDDESQIELNFSDDENNSFELAGENIEEDNVIQEFQPVEQESEEVTIAEDSVEEFAVSEDETLVSENDIDFNDSLAVDNLEQLEPTFNDNIELESSSMLADDFSDISLVASDDANIIGFDDSEGNEDLTEDVTENEITTASEEETETEPEYKSVDYTLFNFEPKGDENSENVDIQDIEAKLANLNNQKPELKIFKVFDLKYKQNLPITEIAEVLQLEKQTVVSALDEIVELI